MKNLLDNDQIDRVHLAHDIGMETLNGICDKSPEMSCIIQSCGARALPAFYAAFVDELEPYNNALSGIARFTGATVKHELERVEEEQLCLDV